MQPHGTNWSAVQQNDEENQWEVSLTHPMENQIKQATAVEDFTVIGRTEERGCSPITVLEGRNAEGDYAALRPLSRSGAHTITTTTSWGAPVSTTTNIMLDDRKSDHCVELTLHSESRFTLHAPGEMCKEVQIPNMQQEHLDCVYKDEREVFRNHHADKISLLGRSALLESVHDSIAYTSNQDGLECNLGESYLGEGVHSREKRTSSPSDVHDAQILMEVSAFCTDKKIPSNMDNDSSADPSCREVSFTNTEHSFNNNTVDETEIERVAGAPLASSIVHDKSQKLIGNPIDMSLSAEFEEYQATSPSNREVGTVCDNSVVLSEECTYMASEIVAPSAHRPTTLMITSNSNESTDNTDCTVNDPAKIGRENDVTQDPSQELSKEKSEIVKLQTGNEAGHLTTGSDQTAYCGEGAIPRPERPSRPIPRTTTLVKVKVEKRLVGSHGQSREKSGHDHLPTPHIPSVEEEVRGLMQEVKEATSQIKQEVKELRQTDTPTPDTPTPLREFREFLNREEEQEQERLPTIKEMCRESEEDASVIAGGEILHGNEHLQQDLSSSLLKRITPVSISQRDIPESKLLDSGYSMLEGCYLVGTDLNVNKFIPSCSESIPEGSLSEPNIKSDLESPLIDSSDASHVDSVGPTTLLVSAKQSKSKFKSLMKKVYHLTSSKGLSKQEDRESSAQGLKPSCKDVSEISVYEQEIENWGTNVAGKRDVREDFILADSVKGNNFNSSANTMENREMEKKFLRGSSNSIVKAPVRSFNIFGNNNIDQEGVMQAHVCVVDELEKRPQYPPECEVALRFGENMTEVSTLEDQPKSPDFELWATRSVVAESPVFNTEAGIRHRSDITSTDGHKNFEKGRVSPSKIDIMMPKGILPDLIRLPKSPCFVYGESGNDVELVQQENDKALEPVIELDESEDIDDESEEKADICYSSMEVYSMSENKGKVYDKQELLQANKKESEQQKVVPCKSGEEENLNLEQSYTRYPHVGTEKISDITATPSDIVSLDTIPLNLGEQLDKVLVSESIEKFYEAKELLPLAQHELVTVTFHQADYPQKIKQIRKIDGISSESKLIHDGHHRKEGPCSEMVYVTGTAAQVNVKEIVFHAAKEMKIPDLSIETSFPTIHHDRNIKDFKTVIITDNPSVILVNDIQRLEQQDLKEKEICVSEGLLGTCKNEFDKIVPQDNKERSYLPYAMEKLSHAQVLLKNECVHGMSDVPSEHEEGSSFVNEKQDVEFGVFSHLYDKVQTISGVTKNIRCPNLNLDYYRSVFQPDHINTFVVSEASTEKELTDPFEKKLQAEDIPPEYIHDENFSKSGHEMEVFDKAIITSHSTNSRKIAEQQVLLEGVGSLEEISPSDDPCDIKQEIEFGLESTSQVKLVPGEIEFEDMDIMDVNTKHASATLERTNEVHKTKVISPVRVIERVGSPETSKISVSKTTVTGYSYDCCMEPDLPSEFSKIQDTGTAICKISPSTILLELEPQSVLKEVIVSDSECNNQLSKNLINAGGLRTDDCKSEQGLMISISKQIEKSGKKVECVVEKETAVVDADIDKSKMEFCKQTSSEKMECFDEIERLHVLDRVSDELKSMISSMEYTLTTGLSKDIKMSHILARLEQLEEVVNDTRCSEADESSISILSNVLDTDNTVSSPQTEALLLKEAEEFNGEKIITKEITTASAKMPVILGKEPSTLNLPGGHSPTGEANGVDLPDALTDVEDLLSDGDQSPMLKRKAVLMVPKQEKDALTDTEDMDLSGEEDEYIQEKKYLPTIQDLGLLPEPSKEVINLTEGFARQASPLLSDSENEMDDVEGRHKKNIQRMENLNETELQVPDETDPEGITDTEDMLASGDEIEEASEAVEEDTMPEHYMDQGEGVSNKEKLNAAPPAPKIFVHHDDDSSDDERNKKLKPRRKSKGGLRVEVRDDGTTDVEDLIVSDKGEDLVIACNKEDAKPKKKKQIRRKQAQKTSMSKTLVAPSKEAEDLTDVEVLTGDDEEEALEDDETLLAVPDYDDGPLTDAEDLEASDTENAEDLLAKPVDKQDPSYLPEPHSELIKISEVEEPTREESGDETDEEGFELDDKDDEKPLAPRKKVIHEPLVTVERTALEVEDDVEPTFTDTEDFDIEDKEEKEIIDDFISRVPEEGEIYTLSELEANMGRISKTEMIKDVHAELKQTIKEAEESGLTLQEALEDETLTDVEDLDDDGKPPKPKKMQQREDETDEESVSESDIEEEIRKLPPKKEKRKGGKRLPLAPQISEVRFIETDHGPLSIIVTPDTLENKPEKVPKDQVSNVVFLEQEERECTTDVEELEPSDDEENRRSKALRAPVSAQEPTTDTEDLDIDPSELDRPLSPLPPNIDHNVFSSPKRELIHIKEDKYGVPQVTIRKLGKDELLVSDAEDAGITDTEDIEVSEGEALRIIGAAEESTPDFELPDTGRTEVSTRMINKPQTLQVEAEEEGGSTDIEELPLTRKPKRKSRSQSKLTPVRQGDESHTDVELLSDQDEKGGLKVRVESPDNHTDFEDIDASENEELELPHREDAPTPDVITNAAIKRIITLKEGPDGIVQTEEATVAPARKNLLQVEEESEGVTDVEDMEASGAEDEDHHEYPALDLPDHEPVTVDISEKSRLPQSSNEAKLIKDNLLLPEDNFNNLTDVESLSEGEGNRCASNTDLLSSQPLTYAVEKCTVEELPQYLPTADPKLCINPGIALENDPFCGELTHPLVVEAELEQLYYHAPQEEALRSEMEVAANNGCVVRKRQVVASTCQAREIRRFWCLEHNSPLQQSEINAFAMPVIHQKGFKTILYLEQPNLLDTISISDTLCDASHFQRDQLLDFESSSVDSFDDHLSYRDSDIITVVDRFNQERSSSSFDELPSPNLSSFSSTGLVDSIYSGRSFSSDSQFIEFSQDKSQRPCCFHSSGSSEDLKNESDISLSLSGISVPSCSPEESLPQDIELVSCEAKSNLTLQRNESNTSQPLTEKSEGLLERCEHATLVSHAESEFLINCGLDCCEDISIEIGEDCASLTSSLPILHPETCIREDSYDIRRECIEGSASECLDMLELGPLESITSNYNGNDTSSCLENSSLGHVQRSITEWVVGSSYLNFNRVMGSTDHADPSENKTGKTLTYKTSSEFSSNLFSDRSVQNYETSEYSNQATSGRQKESLMDSPVKQTVLTPRRSGHVISSELIKEHPVIPFEDSGVHEFQASGGLLDSSVVANEREKLGYESDQISLADSVLGMEEEMNEELALGGISNAVTYISSQFSQASEVAKDSGNCSEVMIKNPAIIVPVTLPHDYPRVLSYSKTKEKSHSAKVSIDISKDFEKISKDFGGVKELIDQWEVIVREEKLKSLPASPAVGRKILPPFEDRSGKTSKEVKSGVNMTVLGSSSQELTKSIEPESQISSVIEEVASVCDIIQQFEGRVSRLGHIYAHRPRLPRGAHSPSSSRSPSHRRRVATVKPLCEPPLQEEKKLSFQDVQVEDLQVHTHRELMENPVSAGFVPRVVESLSVAKSSSDVRETIPTASVSNPEGTHEAAHIAEQQPTALSQDQGKIFISLMERQGSFRVMDSCNFEEDSNHSPISLLASSGLPTTGIKAGSGI
ncbi:hypothetical protein SK128_021412 [Halocaridina rubra]|uniref:Uncharacterized protein n=1 Tax=Halocaridina rubra TaxID=373956 RepID=A0AAN9A6I2_HALRR